MKTKTAIKIKIAIAAVMVLPLGGAFSQGRNKPVMAVLNIQSSGVIPNAESVGRMARLEMEKTNSYSVMDMYDVSDILKKSNIDMENCFGKSCVLEAGKALKAEKMLTGNVERIGEKIAITLKVIDVQTGETEKSYTQEYLNLQQEIQKMIEVSVKRLVGIEPDPNIENLLVTYNQPIETPRTHLDLSGPRIGASYTGGANGERMTDTKDVGGFDMYPVTFQIGWQHEVQYLSAGNFQGLFEFIGLVGGLESGRFIPSLTVLNGFRFGKKGWEFALGPSMRVVKKADGYYDDAGKWHLESEWEGEPNSNTYPIVSRLDSRGQTALSLGLVIAAGRTFKSGYLNMPVNMYVSPRKDGWIVGVSFGFNIHRKAKVEN